MGLPREDILKGQLERATRDIVKQVVAMRDIFRGCEHDSPEAIQNKTEFLVGIVLGRILERCIYYLINRKVQVTSERNFCGSINFFIPELVNLEIISVEH